MTEITLEEIKKIELDILSYVSDFCNNNNIKYYLWGGTLLGAIRHGGFIPWDDDIDIAMPRSDFELFLSKFDSENYGVSYCGIDCNHPYWHAKVYHKNTQKVEPIYYKGDFSIGIDIDVFVLDSYEKDQDVINTVKWREQQRTNYWRSLRP